MSNPRAITVLVVDDSDFFLTLISNQLESNYNLLTKTADGGAEALSVLDQHHVDCVVSDYEMPSMNGLELHERVTEQYDLPFVLLTSEGDENVASRAIGAGVDDYLRKDKVSKGDPMEILVNRIENVVNQRQAQEKYELLVDNSPDEILQVSIDGTIIAANPAVAAAHDVAQTALVGQNIASLLAGDIGRDRIKHGREAVEAGDSVTFQDSIGEDHYHNIAVPVSAGGDRESFQLISRDITDQKERERELQLKTEELAVINRIVRHDINNDIQLLVSWSELLAEHVEADGRTYLDRIQNTCTHIEELTTVARDFIDSIADESETKIEPINLSQVLETEIDKKRTAYDECSITITGEVPDVTVQANELLSSVFGNLLTNAVHHNDGDDPEVDIEVERRDGTVRVHVTDDGPGVPDDRKDEIFGRGEMGPESPGTGIGLHLVHTLVSQYGGQVWVEDNDPTGSTFVVELQPAV